TAGPTSRTIALDSLTETKVDVTLTEDIYNAVPVTDEELTLDITDFGAQILTPQVRAVAEAVENAVADALQTATYASGHDLTMAPSDDPYDVVVDARKALNDANVPMGQRVLVVGSAV